MTDWRAEVLLIIGAIALVNLFGACLTAMIATLA